MEYPFINRNYWRRACILVILFRLKHDTWRKSSILSLTSQQLIYIGVSGFLLFLYVLTWYWGLKYINLSKASTILLLSPVISLILGILWLNEQVSTIQLIGSTIILIGAYLIISTKSEKRIKEV